MTETDVSLLYFVMTVPSDVFICILFLCYWFKHMEQELSTIPEHISLASVFCWGSCYSIFCFQCSVVQIIICHFVPFIIVCRLFFDLRLPITPFVYLQSILRANTSYGELHVQLHVAGNMSGKKFKYTKVVIRSCEEKLRHIYFIPFELRRLDVQR